ncbi:N-acetylglucosamine-6-phosphate deacetylase [Sphingomonas ginkgonis]|uniref:N-acetylglucosamine-6-phosphate deacetylase n=1 Tax=Sphingomonas ginkgonis TaxID=2315330 RepID=A0A429V819_9SPHN|nr:N-acetylglucosamine-6-phosphate deacetylase [Sphingomonas ginkgonis]
MFALCNAQVLIDGAFVEGRAVVVEGERIGAVVPAAGLDPAIERRDLAGCRLVPGFIDVQVNGGGDALFNADPSVATIRRIGEAHRRAGTTGFLPTLISDDLAVIRSGIAAVDAAIEQKVPGVLGIHIEGPFINVERKGIHAAQKIRTLDEEGFAVLTSLKGGSTLVTLAPELAGPAMVERLAAAGVIVAAGHTAASFDEVSAAVAAGLRGVTHLFNAMSPLGSRDPGAVGAALYHDALWCSLIVDGHHVDPVTLKLALRCKPGNRVLLVTDAMPPTGGGRADFVLNGRPITRRDGRLVDADGVLAGADLTMWDAVRRTATMLDVPLPRALAMASEYPAAFLRRSDLGAIAPGKRASLLAIADDGTIRETWIDAQPMSHGKPEHASS